MSELLSFIAKAIRQTDIKPKDFQAGASVLAALGGTQKSEIRQSLDQAKQAGIELSQVGGLALLSNRPLVATVLKESFDIDVVDYTTSGGEIGLYRQGGYPLLAYLAYMSAGDKEYTSLQKRALKWGADPKATWDIPAPIPSSIGDQKPRTISWVAENIRATNVEIAEMLCEKISTPPSMDEQARRLLALSEAISRRTGEFYWDFKSIFDLFAPGGKFALDVTPWDLIQEGKSMAFHNTVVLSRINRYDDNGKALSLFEPWVIKTAPKKSDEFLEIVITCLESKHSFIHLPAWVAKRLHAPQAQAALKAGWPVIFGKWAADRFGGQSGSLFNGELGKTMAEHNLRAAAACLDHLATVATSEPCINGAETPEFLIASVSLFTISKLTVEAVDALAAVYPKFPGAPDAIKVLAPLRELLDERIASSDQEFKRFHEACVLRTQANIEAGTLKKASGALFAPTRAGPRL